MRLSVIRAYFKKEIKELYRENLLWYLYGIPFLFIILFGYGIRMEVVDSRTLIIDYDQSKSSYELISKFEHSKYYDVDVATIPTKEGLDKIKRNEKDLMIIIDSNLQENLLKGQKVHIGVFSDGAFPLRAKTLEGYATGTIYDFFLSKMGSSTQLNKLIMINNRNLFNQGMRDEEMIIPGLIAFILLVVPAMMATFLIVREKENGTIFNFYASPITKSEFLISKLLPVLLLQTVNIFVIWFIAIYMFDLPFRGSFVLYVATSFIYLIISSSIGLLASVVTSSQIVAIIFVAIATVIPGFLYSGMIMPISSMSGEAYVIAHLYPVMYLTHLMYDVFLVGDGFNGNQNISYFFILILYSIILFILSYITLGKKLK